MLSITDDDSQANLALFTIQARSFKSVFFVSLSLQFRPSGSEGIFILGEVYDGQSWSFSFLRDGFTL